jgi:teichuronic acid biosynthesis glycosyltransferase TuaC
MSAAKIIGVSGMYPSQAFPESGTFVEALFENFRGQGVDLDVIAPVPRTRAFWAAMRGKRIPHRTEDTHLFRPRYWTTSARFPAFRFMVNRANHRNFAAAVRKVFPTDQSSLDFAYAHFWTAGWASLQACEASRLPCIVALGESGLDGAYDRIWGPGTFARILDRFAGVVAVSPENEAICRRHCPQLEERLICVPNAVDTERFRPMNRQAARHTLGLPPTDPICIFCGHFIERKGPLRVAQALQLAGGIKGVFLGRGAQRPQGPGVLQAGAVDHNSLPLWLAAANVFVLPSLQEGMSNAIVEALACGVPVVVSDRSFNRSFLDENSATFVDPMDPWAIATGIKRLLHDPALAQRQADAGLLVAQRQTLAERSRRILEFGLGAAKKFRTKAPRRDAE